jgi:hypothetical protein
MLLAADVIPVGVFAVICPLANLTKLLETGTIGLSGSSGTGLKNLLGEDFGGNRG